MSEVMTHHRLYVAAMLDAIFDLDFLSSAIVLLRTINSSEVIIHHTVYAVCGGHVERHLGF